MLEVLYQTTFTVKRESSNLYESDPIQGDDQSPSITIGTPVYLRLILSGFSAGSGTITLTGTDSDDQALSETVTFTSNGRRLSDNEFKTITRVQASGLTNESTVGSLVIESVTETGETVLSLVTKSPIRGRLARPGSSDALRLLGQEGLKRGVIFTKPNPDVQMGDRVAKGSEVWEVASINDKYKRINQEHHTTLILEDFESSTK